MLGAGSLAVLVTGCSSEALYPAVHDMPAARTDTTLTPDQVKQATDSLVSEREHLNTEAQAAGNVQQVSATTATTGSARQNKAAASAQPAAQQYTSSVNAYAKQ